MFIVYTFSQLLKENKARKKSELELSLYTEELKRTNWTKDMFFSIIAHDLRTPYSSLLNLFDLLSEAISKKNISMIEDNINSIEFSARRTYNLLQNLLEWSKLQTGRLHITPEYFNIKKAIEENMDLYKEAAHQRSIECINTVADTIVYADKNMITAVIRNLMGNAIKFTHKGTIDVSLIEQGDHLVLRIRDTGIGMTAQDISKLFKIEVNTYDIGNSSEKGSGLGLILSKSFVELNHGKIWAESEYGKGSSFYFTLPLRHK
ncbi:MAG: HAMP domain-containing histidine kinase [Bacteroidales bacterium]|nr:HAMP domain-containing histidine kinase [Bacteroidales bacterium]